MSTLLVMEADKVLALLEHYDIAPGDSREEVRLYSTLCFSLQPLTLALLLQNLNRFMRFCNIGYQVVPMDPTMAITTD